MHIQHLDRMHRILSCLLIILILHKFHQLLLSFQAGVKQITVMFEQRERTEFSAQYFQIKYLLSLCSNKNIFIM